LPLIGDVHTSGITKLAGGILSAPVTPVLKVKSGTTMLPNVINLGVTGGVYGGIQGSGDGDTPGERLAAWRDGYLKVFADPRFVPQTAWRRISRSGS
jgi:hypothetical protein